MFDLRFIDIVYTILSWTELPPSRYVKEHECRRAKRENLLFSPRTARNYSLTSPDVFLLYSYVKRTYPPYFGMVLSIDKILTSNQHAVYSSGP
jgi:hypothetical protein